MQTARDDRAGKFICHGLRRFIIGGRLHLVDINAVAVTLGVDDARGKLRRDDRLLIHARELRVERAAVAGLADGFADAVDPMTMMTRCASSGITGSWEACALSGRRLAPSASTSTKSASCASVPIESRGAQSLPLSACEATQTMPDRSNAAETAASSASSSVSYCSGR